MAFILVIFGNVNVSDAKLTYSQVLEDFEIDRVYAKQKQKGYFISTNILEKPNENIKIDSLGNLISVNKLDYLYSNNKLSKYDSKESIVKMLYDKNYIGKDYFLYSKETSFNNVDEYIFIKKYDNNLENFYDSIKLLIKNDDNTILGFNRFREFIEPKASKISES